MIIEGYSRSGFYDLLDEVRDLAAELRGIERGLEYMEEERARWWQHIPLGHPVETIRLEFGKTEPFTRTYQIPGEGLLSRIWDPKEAELRENLEQINQEARTWAADEVAALTTKIQHLTHPTAAMYQQILAPLEQVEWNLTHHVVDDYGKLEDSLSEWKGTAATNFRTDFYRPFGNVVGTQHALTVDLIKGVHVAKEIAAATQKSLMRVGYAVRGALVEQLQRCAVESGLERAESTRNALIIGGTLAGIFGSLFTGGIAAGGVASVSGGLNLSTLLISDEDFINHEITGSTAEELTDRFASAVRAIDENGEFQHEGLANELRTLLGRVEELQETTPGQRGAMTPVRPDLVEGVDGETFHMRGG